MAVQKYDIRNPVERGGQFEERYWSPVNSPVLDANKEVEYIIHRVEDVTEFVRLRQKRVEFERLNETLRQHLAQMESEIYVRTQEIAQANLHLKELNAQITQEHEKLKTLVESIDDEVWFYDVQDNVVFMNSAVTRNIGFEKCENCSLTEIFDRLKILNTDGAPRPIEQFPLYRSATYGDNLTDEEIVRHLETGELRHRHYTSAPVRDRTGQIIGAVAIVRDITDIKRLMSRLQEALDNVKILSGILPICSSCKKIKDDDGNWIQLESYIHERSDADFSHGICPDCTKKLYPDFYKKIEEQLRNPANKVSESK